jgi:hypothetical protein
MKQCISSSQPAASGRYEPRGGGGAIAGFCRPIGDIQRTEWPSPKGTLLVGLLAGVTVAFSVAILNLGLLEFTYPLNGEYQ